MIETETASMTLLLYCVLSITSVWSCKLVVDVCLWLDIDHYPLIAGQSQDSGLGGSTQDVIVFGTAATDHEATTPHGQFVFTK